MKGDWHITALMGIARDHVCIEGHIFIKMDKFKPGKSQIPLGLLPLWKRTALTESEGDDGITPAEAYVLELYGCGGSAGFRGRPFLPAWVEDQGLAEAQSTEATTESGKAEEKLAENLKKLSMV